ncbi:GNAT family N-acetyltransferase [Paenibacillus sp. SI8]|uniref:GNAT family N-acetyltransferase n=1 Tax=unclassified Paenibacillus TaxID=185978 RepID=UPI0034674803
MTTQNEIHIRDARVEDRDDIERLMVAAYEQYADVLPAPRWEQYEANIRASVDKEGPVARIVAELDGRIVGSVLLFVSSEDAYGRSDLNIHTPIIRLLSVSPSVRGKGIATALIKESVRRSLELGAELLHLHTSDMMASAVRLYERLGFERAVDKDMYNGETLVKSYKLHLKQTAIL